MLKEGLDFVKDVLFPVFCVECKSEGIWWCQNCISKQSINSFSFKPQAGNSLNMVTAFFDYKKNKVAAKLIKQFKYNAAADMQQMWDSIMKESRIKNFGRAGVYPVPLHARRKRERGFNQAEILAMLIAKNYGYILYTKQLGRRRYTKQQAKLNKKQRLENVRGAFIWSTAEAAADVAILVDDVYTTGATMQECALVLKQKGAKEVWGVVLARD
jgi:competence protein ComFC